MTNTPSEIPSQVRKAVRVLYFAVIVFAAFIVFGGFKAVSLHGDKIEFFIPAVLTLALIVALLLTVSNVARGRAWAVIAIGVWTAIASFGTIKNLAEAYFGGFSTEVCLVILHFLLLIAGLMLLLSPGSRKWFRSKTA